MPKQKENSNYPTNEQYEAAIPDCCRFRTAEDHYGYLLWCWGLLSAMRDGRKMECGQCEYADRKAAHDKDV